MSDTGRTTSSPKKSWGRMMALAGVLVYLLASLLLSITGCETPAKRYRVLSFFFDGVPNPNAPRLAAQGSEDSIQTVAGAGGARTRVYVHKPYDEGHCYECHGEAKEFFEFKPMGSEVCLKCHRKELDKYPVMHGPVASAECLLCHAPHESQYTKLLKEPSPQVCVRCHLPELLPQEPAEHQSASVSCLNCHNAHGGDKHGLLKKIATTTTAPTTAPSSQPTALLPNVPQGGVQ
jgi:predicted CXXCH cytochrome family protein